MSKTDFYQDITNKIIVLLDTINLEDYQAPFAGLVSQGVPLNPTTKNRYKGVNILSLWFNQQDKEFSSNKWATYKQWQDIGAQVRLGEKSSRVLFYKEMVETNDNTQTNEEAITKRIIKVSPVFNANQVDNYEHEPQGIINETDLVTPMDIADQFCKNTKVEIRQHEGRAYYDAAKDFIGMPSTKEFVDTKTAKATELYYSTLLHELTHWTGSKRRLGRFKKIKEAKQAYAFEELVAELGAAFMCASLGITQSGREDHAQYIKSWLQVLKDDKKHISKAAAYANKAVEYLGNLQPSS